MIGCRIYRFGLSSDSWTLVRKEKGHTWGEDMDEGVDGAIARISVDDVLIGLVSA